MSKPIQKGILFRTTVKTDVLSSGGVISVAGLKSVRRSNLLSIKQIKYRPEVVQVYTVSTTATPTGSTVYGVLIGDTNRVISGAQAQLVKYTYTTPADITDLGATAALQREAINVALIAKINADTANYVVAATLAGGTGFTITDDAGYYPVNSQTANNRKGASEVVVYNDGSGAGFASTVLSLTTAAVYSFGVGADVAAGKPVIDVMYGNLISGTLVAPPLTITGLPGVSGQKYDAFVITSLSEASAHSQTGQYALVPTTQTIWVDNGTGSDTANLAGFKDFERIMHKLMFSLYKNDPNAVGEFFDMPIAFQDPLGAAPTGTANTLGWQVSPYASLNRTNIGTQTIVAPVLNATGLLIDQDDNAGDGSHTSASQQTVGGQEFTVGKSAFMVVANIVMGDWTDSHILVGFRKKAAYTADYNDYTDLAAIGSGAAAGDTITTTGILNNAATVATASAASYTDAVAALLVVKVAIDGTVTCQVNGTSYPVYSAGTTALILDAGDVMIPFYQHVNIGSGDPAVSISEFFAVADNYLIA